jgi:hypothetical protein
MIDCRSEHVLPSLEWVQMHSKLFTLESENNVTCVCVCVWERERESTDGVWIGCWIHWLPLMNMLCISSRECFTHIACYWKFFLLHYVRTRGHKPLYTWIYIYIYIRTHAHTHTRRKVNILGGHSIGILSIEVYMYMCPIPNGFRDTDISYTVHCKMSNTHALTQVVECTDADGVIFENLLY